MRKSYKPVEKGHKNVDLGDRTSRQCKKHKNVNLSDKKSQTSVKKKQKCKFTWQKIIN